MSDLETLSAAYRNLKSRNQNIDMTRGKPSAAQLDLAAAMFDLVSSDDCKGADGTDYRNYGILAGIPEVRALFAELMETTPDLVIAGGNGSLQMMYDALLGAVMFGVPGGDGPWTGAKFICPVPGYDRHFAICERLGIEMIPVEMLDDGPDMDAVETLVADDASIKGIWCVPKYSNPTGAVYSDLTVDRLAAMKTAAPDFRIMWDNAYVVHHLTGDIATVKNIQKAAEAAGNADRILTFVSTSKITLAGAGVAAMSASKTNIDDQLERMFYSSIGPDKVNQLRHVRFFKDTAGIAAHMVKHAEIIAPKFAVVEKALTAAFEGTDLASWTKPEGGYFVSVDLADGCAAETVKLCAEAGVKLTASGACFPYGKDPRDRNIRLAPTMPTEDELERAMEVFCTTAKMVCLKMVGD
ncbi:aminotransferase class I/II-fold pyridoxal phosphate-dependent enzyme [Nisaea nitritireducens]|uniref:aminotransferase class I/II-fold pyridoxal phosphate-dependent enzyme n=1 Tax=Nisaea nitritireducens TaxID=568392 RepID=UPI00186807D7|nr:aminotransferase class I/II-fold pyridoxal phosphate-dependent enzyme [Nisaea nitritireducens]